MTEIMPELLPDNQSENFSKQEIRKNSKERHAADRNKVAEEIRIERKNYFNDIAEIQNEIASLVSVIEQKKLTFENAVDGIHSVEADINSYRKTRALRFLNLFRIRKLEAELAKIETVKDKIEEDYLQLREQLEALQGIKISQVSLEQARVKLDLFYTDQADKLQEFKEFEKKRDIRNIADRHNCFFIHGIQSTIDTPESNTLIEKGVDWETKLKIALVFQPTLSASSIKEGNTARNMWARSGVVLRSGKVETAAASDNATVAASIKKRMRAGYREHNYDSLVEDVGKAAQGTQDRYNEFTIENPEVAGIYISIDEYDPHSYAGHEYIDHISVYNTAEEIGVPVFVIENGKLFSGTFNKSKGKFDKGESINFPEVFEANGEVALERKTKIMEDIFADSPFKADRLNTIEPLLIDSQATGRAFYLYLMLGKNIGQIEGYAPLSGEKNYAQSLFDKEIKKVASFPSVGRIEEYFECENTLYKRTTLRRVPRPSSGDREPAKVTVINAGNQLNTEFGSLNIGGRFWNGGQIKNVSEYFKAMSEMVENQKKYLAESGEKYAEAMLKSIACHLYGFGYQAGESGDEETKKKAFEMMEGIITPDECVEIIMRRLGPNGELRITDGDLGK